MSQERIEKTCFALLIDGTRKGEMWHVNVSKNCIDTKRIYGPTVALGEKRHQRKTVNTNS